MKLNLDCVRAVLLSVEDKPLGKTLSVRDLENLTKHSEEDVIYTCLKLEEAGFLDLLTVPMRSTIPGIKAVCELTYSGHEFLDTIRPDDIWTKTKQHAKALGSFSLPTIQSIATKLLETTLQGLF